MNRKRTRSGRRDRRAHSGITLRDYEDLEALLAGKPEVALSYFAAAGIGCLMELALFERLVIERPEAAHRIAVTAALRGIPIRAAREG